jgi:hypothetical protein
MKSKFAGNKNVTISVDKSGKVTKKKKDKQKARKMARVLKKVRKKGKGKSKRSLAKTKRSSLYKRLKEMNMEDITKYDPSDDISALFDGEELSDEFKTKASTVLEAAVNSNVKKIAEEMAEKEEAEEIVAEEESEVGIVEQVDKYLDYVVEEWMEENKVAVDQGIKNDLTEQFITGLKTLFKESYIEIPEEKVDVVSELTNQIEKLQSELNEERKFVIEMKDVIDDLKQDSIIDELTDSLVETEAAKIKELSESIDFVTEEDFREKITSLKESYFPETKKVLTEDNVEEDPVVNHSGSMGVYTSALDRMNLSQQ